MKNLAFAQCYLLLQSVFSLGREEKGLTILTDLPKTDAEDSAAWQDRRRIATEWFLALQPNIKALPFTSVSFCVYENVGSNNNDLPEHVILIDRSTKESPTMESQTLELSGILASSSVVLAITEYSATAPLKILAREHKFRGATLPGFTREMLPALGLDYGRVHSRVMVLKERLDRAQSATAVFRTGGKTHTMVFDLRFRTAHASGGQMPDPGSVGNLPSGEAYIVPYEGEIVNEPSKTAGTLPVQFGDEVVLFAVKGNRVTNVLSIGKESEIQRHKLLEEPAYGNIAELGLGILGEFGIKAIGSTLIDEKLGLHVAFGRSDHFGGTTGPANFLDQRNVVHIDWIYVQSAQPDIIADELTLDYGTSSNEIILKRGKIVV
jgi:leucyl aminopeptidase (aminopeptidase T)